MHMLTLTPILYNNIQTPCIYIHVYNKHVMVYIESDFPKLSLCLSCTHLHVERHGGGAPDAAPDGVLSGPTHAARRSQGVWTG